MSAWIRSVTGRAHQYEPLNAKQFERPGNMDFKSSVHPLHFDLLAVRQGGRAPAPAVEPAFRQVSYARRAQSSTGDCDHFSPPCSSL